MIEFVSVFLGLMTGPQPVELDVTGPVAEIELRLDGEQVATLSGAPWALDCDLGQELAVHELVAIARDAKGHELDRTARWLNLVGQTSEATMSFEGGEAGRPAAALLHWESIGQRRPLAVEVSFDGEPLAVRDPHRVPLPSYNPRALHFVSATVRFTDQLVSRMEAGFGGVYGDEVATELTAVAVVLEGRRKLPPPEKLRSWFVKAGRPLAVHGVEKGGAEVLLVRDPGAQPYFDSMARRLIDQRARTGEYSDLRRAQEFLYYFAMLSEKTAVSFVSPLAAPLPTGEVTAEMFLGSGRLEAAEGLLWLARETLPRSFPLQLADAAALAGSAVYSNHRRRAVVLVLGERPEDVSHLSAARVREFLRQLQVPLHVWSMTPTAARGAWGAVRLVGDPVEDRAPADELQQAVKALRRELAAQRIVWLEGRHLPQSIRLSAAAKGVRLAGQEGPG